MATRFYFQNQATGAPVTVAISASWNATVSPGISSTLLVRKLKLDAITTIGQTSSTITGTSTASGCRWQFISEPLRAQTITGTVSMVVRVAEDTVNANCTLALIVRAVSQDGGTVRGTVFSNLSNDTEYPTTNATRVIVTVAVTSTAILDGDRLVAEVGTTWTTPTTNSVATYSIGTSGTGDHTTTTNQTSNTLNPWIEFSQDLWPALPENYKSVKVASGISVGERIR